MNALGLTLRKCAMGVSGEKATHGEAGRCSVVEFEIPQQPNGNTLNLESGDGCGTSVVNTTEQCPLGLVNRPGKGMLVPISQANMQPCSREGVDAGRYCSNFWGLVRKLGHQGWGSSGVVLHSRLELWRSRRIYVSSTTASRSPNPTIIVVIYRMQTEKAPIRWPLAVSILAVLRSLWLSKQTDCLDWRALETVQALEQQPARMTWMSPSGPEGSGSAAAQQPCISALLCSRVVPLVC